MYSWNLKRWIEYIKTPSSSLCPLHGYTLVVIRKFCVLKSKYFTLEVNVHFVITNLEDFITIVNFSFS